MRSSRGGWPLTQCDWGSGTERACGPAMHREKPRDGGGGDQSDVYRPRDMGTASSTGAGAEERGWPGQTPLALGRPPTGTLTLARRPRRGGEQAAVVSSPHWWDFVPWPWGTDHCALDRISTPRVPRSQDRSRDPARLPLRHACVY